MRQTETGKPLKTPPLRRALLSYRSAEADKTPSSGGSHLYDAFNTCRVKSVKAKRPPRYRRLRAGRYMFSVFATVALRQAARSPATAYSQSFRYFYPQGGPYPSSQRENWNPPKALLPIETPAC